MTAKNRKSGFFERMFFVKILAVNQFVYSLKTKRVDEI
jgi:hypothetical protein